MIKRHNLIQFVAYILGSILSFNGLAETGSQSSKSKVQKVDEVSIIGNTELPNVSFDLAWRLPSVEKRDDQSPPNTLPGMLVPLEPLKHKQLVYFSRYLEVDVPQFRTK